jgi:hypothetical protein
MGDYMTLQVPIYLLKGFHPADSDHDAETEVLLSYGYAVDNEGIEKLALEACKWRGLKNPLVHINWATERVAVSDENFAEGFWIEKVLPI